MTELPKPDYARNMRVVGHTDQGGRPDGVQVMVHRGFAFVGHMFSKGFSIIDVRDPTNPRAVNYIAAPAKHWNIHLQAHEDLLLVIHAKDMFAAAEFADERAYYSGALGKTVGTAEAKRKRDWSAGLAVYDISNPEKPRQIGFMPVEGGGIHRAWYTGGRWAYVSVLLDGFTDYMFMTVDMSDPAKPREAGRWWIPGMNLAAGETPSWPASRRYGLHHAIIHGDRAYAAWRDAGMVVLDIADRAKPKLIVHRNWSPPFGGGTHNCPALARPRSARRARRSRARPPGRRPQADLGVSTTACPRTRSASRRFRRRQRPTTRPRAPISGRTISMRTGPGSFHQFAADLRDLSRTQAFASSTCPMLLHRKKLAPWCRRSQDPCGHPPEPRACHSVRRRLCGRERADLRDRLQCRALYSGIQRRVVLTCSSSA
jgi:hypothetical protein